MLEAQLVNDIIKYLNKYKIRNTTEIRMGIGVPDITLNMGASKTIPLISDYYLLSLAEFIDVHHGATLSDILNHFSFDKSRILSYLNQLISADVISVRKDKYYSRRKILGLHLGTTISIEAKIKDWRSGILQAERYLLFSDYSYLALPAEKARNVNETHLQKIGIGLLAVSGGKIEELVSPIKSSICDYKQKYIATSGVISESHSPFKRRSDSIFSNLK